MVENFRDLWLDFVKPGFVEIPLNDFLPIRYSIKHAPFHELLSHLLSRFQEDLEILWALPQPSRDPQ